VCFDPASLFKLRHIQFLKRQQAAQREGEQIPEQLLRGQDAEETL